MDETRAFISLMYNHLETYKCLCKFVSDRSTRDLWDNVLQQCFEKNSEVTSDTQLLCASFLRLIGENYINATLKYHCVCSHVHHLFEIISSKEVWIMFIHHLKFSQDRYLTYIFIKIFTVILSVSHESVFSDRINTFLLDIKDNLFSKWNLNLLDFLSNLIQFNFKPIEIDFNIELCSNVHSEMVCVFKDLFQSTCTLLSQYWSFFIQQFHEIVASKCENENIVSFLMLWQRIIQRPLAQDLLPVYLSEDSVIIFLSDARNLDVMSLRIYVDIIMQFFISSLKGDLPETNLNNSVEKAATAALENNFFQSLPSDIQLSGLGILTDSRQKESTHDSSYEDCQKCDSVIVKKTAFIFLNLISGFKCKVQIYNATVEIFNFVKQNFDIPSSQPVYAWINDVFVDQDDILLGVMFVLLKIYINLKKEDITMNFSKYTDLQNDLNPHEIFINFLQRLGFDHNELIAFLTSDETCFLHYIMHYLKLLFQEWDLFIEKHEKLIKTDEDIFECNSSNISQEEELFELPESSSAKKLVSYSSSSSEEEIQFTANNEEINESASFQNLIVVKTLVKLKETLNKLVAADEFPYNVSPLIVLLQTCENYCISRL